MELHKNTKVQVRISENRKSQDSGSFIPEMKALSFPVQNVDTTLNATYPKTQNSSGETENH